MRPPPISADHLRRAVAAPPLERPTLLAAAEAVSCRVSDWLAIAEAWLELDRPDDAARCLVAAEPLLGPGWDMRRAANAWLRIGDADRAVGVVEAVEARAAAETCGLTWRLLAAAFDALQDPDGVARCLATGRARARDADDLCEMAEGHVELLGDTTTARALLEDGLSRSADVRSCLTIADARAAWRDGRHRRTPATDACLAAARRLAATFQDWHEIAAQMHELGHDPEEIRVALLHAQEFATRDERLSLARRMRDWVQDPEAAAALGPMGLRPAQLAAPGPSPLGWQRDAGALFDWLRERVTDAALEVVASGDYQTDEQQHLAALREIRDTGLVPLPLAWHPLEVVSLYQWSEGEDVDHAARAFGCTVICLPELVHAGQGRGGLEDTFAVLLESCCVLGEDAESRAMGLLVAFADGPQHVEPVVVAFATLGLLLVAARRDSADPRLDTVAARLLALEAELTRDGYRRERRGFVLGATYFDQRVDVWSRLVREVLLPLDVAVDMPSLAEVVHRFAAKP
ncbi:MAG: hypothetical protein JNL08_13125 [Planctomycetes bacterium]|nr:hypothetical protein [Planctomycetota bacterium]